VAKNRLHPDEINAIESRAQTEHKLEVMRRYYPSYSSIIAQSKSKAIDNRHIWLVDLFAGAGLHRSADHPDGRVLGTALQACAAARDVQRRSQSQVHVRLVDLDKNYCDRLRPRVDVFRQQGVDAVVVESDYAAAITPILREISASGDKCLSLWLVDPHGPKILAFNSLLPLLSASGVEIVINLDITGVERMRGFVLSPKVAADKKMSEMAIMQRRNLNELFKGDYWESPSAHVQTQANMNLEAMLAQAYLLPFSMFKYKQAYPLRASDSQFRSLIHLTRSASGQTAFKKAYDASWKIGTAKGLALTDPDCERYCRELFPAYSGIPTSLEDIFTDALVDLNRGQLGRVLRYAANNDYGEFDGNTMIWKTERLDAWALPTRDEDDDQPRLF